MSNAESVIILDSENSDNDEEYGDEDQRTIFCANFSPEVTEELLYELFLQAGPIDEVRIPKESDGKRNKSYAFIVYEHKCTVPYALKLYEGVKLFNRTLDIKLSKRTIQKQNNDKTYSIQNNNAHNLYQSLISSQQIINSAYPLNMMLLDQRYNNTGFNNINTGFNHFNLGLLNSNLDFNSFNNLNPIFNHLNPGLTHQFNQGLNNLNPSGLVNLNQGISNFNPTINNLNSLY